MAKTALELTPEEQAKYQPGKRYDQAQSTERLEKAWLVAHAAARLLREQFGATRVVAFGSLAHRLWFTPWSDIDLAAWGIPPESFFRAVASVTDLAQGFELNLVDPERCQPHLRQAIERGGVDV
jgi:predicted nucleotidyltransferase